MTRLFHCDATYARISLVARAQPWIPSVHEHINTTIHAHMHPPPSTCLCTSHYNMHCNTPCDNKGTEQDRNRRGAHGEGGGSRREKGGGRGGNGTCVEGGRRRKGGFQASSADGREEVEVQASAAHWLKGSWPPFTTSFTTQMMTALFITPSTAAKGSHTDISAN